MIYIYICIYIYNIYIQVEKKQEELVAVQVRVLVVQSCFPSTKVQMLTADTYFTGCVAGGVPRLQN
jgi:hypothetical protein